MGADGLAMNRTAALAKVSWNMPISTRCGSLYYQAISTLDIDYEE